MQFDTKLLQLLMDIGFLASSNGLVEESEAIFNGLKAVRDESEYPIIGIAMAKINANKPEEAVRILKEEAMEINADNDLIKAYLGLAYKLLKKETEAVETFNQIIANDSNQEAVQMARVMLGQLDVTD